MPFLQICSLSSHLGSRDIEGPDDPLQGPPEGRQLLVQQHAAALHIDVRTRRGGAKVQEVNKPATLQS